MSKLTLVVDNTKKRPDPKNPGGVMAVKPTSITQAIGLRAA